MPTSKGFEADADASVDASDRLEDKRQFFVEISRDQRFLDDLLSVEFVRLDGVEDHSAGTVPSFSGIKSVIGEFVNLLSGRTDVGIERKADRPGHLHHAAANIDAFGNQFADLFTERHRIAFSHVALKQKTEFVTAEPVDR